MKKLLYLTLILVIALGVFAGCNSNSKYNTELIQNGTFEQGGTTLSSWLQSKDIASSSDGVLTFEDYEAADDNYGKSYLVVTNGSTTGNYIRLYQEVEVTRNAVYKITARIKNGELKVGKDDLTVGGGIEILENEASVILSDSTVIGEWTEFTAYIKPKNTSKITVAMTFGAETERTVGNVAFDGVSMVRVKASSVPADADVVSIYKTRTQDYPLSSVGGTLFVVFLAILTAVIFGVFYYWFRKSKFKEDNSPVFKNYLITAGVIGIATIGFRLLLAGVLFDNAATASLAATAKAFVDLGIGNAMQTYTAYSPLQVYLLWIAGKIVYNFTSLGAMSVMLRFVPILCEGVTAALIYIFAKKYVTDKQATVFGIIYAIIPVFFTLSAGYGVEIPVLTLLLLIMFYALIEKEYVVLLASSLITVLWSPIGIYVLPFVVVYEIYIMLKTKDKKTILTFTIGWAVSFVLFILLSAGAVANIFKQGHIMYIFESYYLMVFDKQTCVSNAFNVYALFGLNGNNVNNAAFWLNIVFSLVLMIYALSLYFRNFNRAEMMLLAGFYLTIMSVFSLNMDETALAMGLILLLAYVIITGEERLYWVFAFFAFMAFVNTGIIMNFSGAFGETFKYTFFNKGDAGYAVANVMAALAALYYGWVVYDITTNGRLKYLQPIAPSAETAL